MAMAARADKPAEKHSHEKKTFTCSLCKFEMEYHYYGNKPPFAKSLMLLEDCYVMKDPFSTSGGLITVGAVCSLCHSVVCMANDCSLFYSKRFCIPCVLQHLAEFPEEIQEITDKRCSMVTVSVSTLCCSCTGFCGYAMEKWNVFGSDSTLR